MNWFEGSITEAIRAAKAAKGIFVVFIDDSSNSSKTSIAVLNEEPVSKLLRADNIVSIKLEHGSLGADQFAAIYTVQRVPAIFFIGGNDGVLRETIVGPFEESTMIDKIANLKLHFLKNSENNEAENHARCVSSQSYSTNEPKSEDASSNIKENAVESDEKTESSVESRVERATVLAAELQRDKQLEKDENERRRELERRQVGQEMARTAKEREDLQKGNYAMQRKKEKAEDKLARERVKAQIAADRSERLARQALLRGEDPPASQNLPQASGNTTSQTNSDSRDSNTTRIKFRLPDGSSIQARFQSDAKLSDLESHLRQQGLTPPVIMCSLFHQNRYSEEEMRQSLTELCLVPSAIIIVKSKSSTSSGTGSSMNSVVSSTGDSLYSLMVLMLTPFSIIINYVMQMLGLKRKDNKTTKNAEKDNDTKQEKINRSQKGKKKFRKDGNVHRLGNLSDDDDDDDDNNTWNGNSTQQM